MPRRVQGPDGIVHEFPDDATDQEISEALSTPPATARGKPQRSWTDTAVDALPMVGGAVGGILGAATGIPTMGLSGIPAATAGAGFLGAGGEAFRQLINRARGVEAPTSPEDAAASIGTQGAVQGGMELAGGLAMKGIGAVGKSVYRGFLKPSLAKKSIREANAIVETAIRERIPITKGGVDRADRIASRLREQVAGMLTRADADGQTIDLTTVANKVRAFAKENYYQAGKPSADFDAAMQVAADIDSHASLGGVTDVTLTQANKIKQGLYESVGDNYGLERSAATEARKTGARAIRQKTELGALASWEAGVGALNARQGSLIEAGRAINRAVEREANQSMLHGAKTGMAALFGLEEGYRTNDPYAGAVRALGVRVMLTPGVATRAAVIAARLGNASGALPADVARIAIQVASETQDQAESGPEY